MWHDTITNSFNIQHCKNVLLTRWNLMTTISSFSFQEYYTINIECSPLFLHSSNIEECWWCTPDSSQDFHPFPSNISLGSLWYHYLKVNPPRIIFYNNFREIKNNYINKLNYRLKFIGRRYVMSAEKSSSELN